MPWRRRDRKLAEPAQPTSVSISGVTNSAIATGSNNQQHVSSPVTTPAPEPAALDSAIAALRAVIEAQTGPNKNEALSHVNAIDAAAHTTPPDATRLAAAAAWIKAAIPAAAPAIARVIEHPSLDSAITAAAQVIHDTATRVSPTARQSPPAAAE